MAELVSVVITCHNLEAYIGTAVESVLAQTWAGALDIVVVDDFSTDRSREIIAGFPQVRLVSTESNVGVLMSTVIGLRETLADVVFFLDGDDVWIPQKIERVATRFASQSALGLLTHDLEFIDALGNAVAMMSRPEAVMAARSAPEDALIRDGILLHSDYVWLGSAYAIRKSAIGATEFCDWACRLPDPFNTYQDWPLAFWAASHLPRAEMGYVPEKLFKYRLHGANHSGDARSVAKARRNVLRTFNTMAAMEDIAVRMPAPAAVMSATRRKKAFYGYLIDLYAGRRAAAALGFVGSIPYMASCGARTLAREMIRLACVQIIGLDRFLAFASNAKRGGVAA